MVPTASGSRATTRRPRSSRRSPPVSARCRHRKRWPLIADLGVAGLLTRLELSPELQRRRTIELLVQWTLAVGAVQPMVMLFEDLHWWGPVVASSCSEC